MKQVEIVDLLNENCMEYAKYTILDRAIVDISGFKPIHRRIIWSMYLDNLAHNKNRTKSINAVGSVLRFSPHGDASVYSAMVRLANDSVNHPLIDGKGAFGTVTSSKLQPSASRYTEVRMSPITQELLKGIDKNVVDMLDNYDSTKKEPEILPVTIPMILINPNLGIAVGIASNICGFDIKEVCYNASKVMLKQEADIMIPDFPTGGYIVNNPKVFNQIHNTGTGSVKIRAKYTIKDNTISVTEIPYTTTREAIINKIVELARDGKLKEVTDVNDYSGKQGLEIGIDFKKNTNVEMLMAKLFKMTPLESSFACNFTVLIDEKPKVLGVQSILEHWCDFRMGTARRSIQYDMKQLEKELEPLYGLRMILPHVEECINIIRYSKTDEDVITNLMKFGLNERQAKYVANLKIRTLNEEHINKHLIEIAELEGKYNQLAYILDNEDVFRNMLAQQLIQLGDKYSIPRKSELIDVEHKTINLVEEIIEDYNVQIFVTKEGYLKKVPLTSIKSTSSHKLKDGDKIISDYTTTNKAEIIIFTNLCNAYKIQAHTLEDHKLSVMGVYLPTIVPLEKDEVIVGVVATEDYADHLLVAYDNGKVAKVTMKSFETKTKRTKLSNSLSAKANVVKVDIVPSTQDNEYFLVSDTWKILYFNTTNIPEKTTRSTEGVYVMYSKTDYKVIDCVPVKDCTVEEIEYYQGGKVGKTLLEGDVI